MSITKRGLLATMVLCALSCTTLAAAPTVVPTDEMAPEPHMSHAEALAFLDTNHLALAGDNLVMPIMNGDLETVEALLSAGVDVNDTRDLPKPVLRLAASACSRSSAPQVTLAMVDLLLTHGARVNDPAPSELSALMVAAQECPAPVVRRLLRAGADMNFRTSLGHTSLSMALLVGNYDAAEALIAAGARISPETAKKLLADKKGDSRLTALVAKARRP